MYKEVTISVLMKKKVLNANYLVLKPNSEPLITIIK